MDTLMNHANPKNNLKMKQTQNDIIKIQHTEESNVYLKQKIKTK